MSTVARRSTLNDACQHAPGNSRLADDVMFLHRVGRVVSKQILSTDDVLRIHDRPERATSRAEAMEIYRKSERLFGALAHCVINGSVIHRGIRYGSMYFENLVGRGKSCARRDFISDFISSAGMSSDQQLLDLTRCLPIRSAEIVRLLRREQACINDRSHAASDNIFGQAVAIG
jgi:hypothetical protein